MQNNNEFKGYSLFNDLEDVNLQAYNRARILRNIMEDHSVDRNVTKNGMMLIAGYFMSIPEDQRPATYNEFVILSQKKKEL